MYQLLKEAAIKRPVAGNQNGSYMTLKSNFALIFGVIQLCSGSGLAWFAIPFGFATTLGLAAVALTDSPTFPTYPSPLSQGQVTSGLAASSAATALLGKGGAVALLIVLFMAVTSCLSAELIAVSSILTFDIYKTYIKKNAAPNQLIFVSHVMICVFGLTVAVFACIWNGIVMGLLIGGAVFPAAFAITWVGQTSAGALSGAISGLAAGLIAWLTTAHQCFGAVTVSTTGEEYSTLAGNLAAIMTGLIVTVAVSLARPKPFSWESTRSINTSVLTAASSQSSTEADPKETSDLSEKTNEKADEKADEETSPSTPTSRDEEKGANVDLAAEEPTKLRRAFKVACIASFLLTFIMDFLIPMPMFFSHYIFSQGFFTAWVVITFIWVFCSAAITTVLPLVEAGSFFKALAKEILRR
ncbi:MAG: hypothetical protein Q9195_006656 [Heterodermia aff. obscurata]